MPLLDNVSGSLIEDIFYSQATAASIQYLGFDTVNYIKVFFIVSYLASGSSVTDFQIEESDSIGSGYTTLSSSNLIRGTFDDFLITQGTPFVSPIVPPVIGVFGTKRYLGFTWTTTNVGAMGILLQVVGESKIKPYLQ